MISSRFAHSAEVTLELQLGDRRISLAQAAHNFGITAEPVYFPPGNGVVVMTIDGRVEHIHVVLPDGCSMDDPKFPWQKTNDNKRFDG
jgi:hypothetical protein